MAVSSHWADLLTPALSDAFYTSFGRVQSSIPSLFSMRSSGRADEQSIGVGALGAKNWAFDGANGSGRVNYDDLNKGFKTTFTHVQFAKGFYVERKLADDNLTDIAFDSSAQLGDSAFRKRELSAASVFNNAFTSTTNADGNSTLGADGVVLCSASHPYSADDATTQSNTGTAALTKANVSAARVSMMRLTDDRGDIMNIMPDTILVPPDLEDAALEITKSLLDPTSAQNAINPQAGRYRLIVWNYLTDTNNWFLIDSTAMRNSLRWYDRIPLEFGREEDFDTFTGKYRAYMRYSYGWTRYEWLLGQNVA